MCQKAIVHFFWMSIYLPPRIDVHRESVQGFDHGFHPSPPLCAAKRHHLSLRVRAVHAGFLHLSLFPACFTSFFPRCSPPNHEFHHFNRNFHYNPSINRGTPFMEPPALSAGRRSKLPPKNPHETLPQVDFHWADWNWVAGSRLPADDWSKPGKTYYANPMKSRRFPTKMIYVQIEPISPQHRV